MLVSSFKDGVGVVVGVFNVGSLFKRVREESQLTTIQTDIPIHIMDKG